MKRKEKRRNKKNKVQSAPVQQTSRTAKPSETNGYPQYPYPYPPYPPMYPTPYPMNRAPYPMYPGQTPYQQPPMCYGPMGNGINPCAMPSRFIQLTPIVQPIAMVPYSTQRQPLAMYDDFGYGRNGMEYGEDYGYEGYSGMDYINGNEEDL